MVLLKNNAVHNPMIIPCIIIPSIMFCVLSSSDNFLLLKNTTINEGKILNNINIKEFSLIVIMRVNTMLIIDDNIASFRLYLNPT